MVDGKFRVVNLCLALSVHSVESKLLLVNSVREPKEWIVGSLNHAYDLIKSRVILATLVISCNWNQLSQLLVSNEGIESDTNVDLVIEGDVVEETLKVTSKDLIVSESVSWYKV